jgi:hypothetical protein
LETWWFTFEHNNNNYLFLVASFWMISGTLFGYLLEVTGYEFSREYTRTSVHLRVYLWLDVGLKIRQIP